MSDFLAEARVLVRPDTSKFRAELQAQLLAIKVAPVTVPIVAAGAGLAGAAAATAGLAAAQKVAAVGALDLDTDEKILNSTLARQAIILEGLTAQTLAQAGAQRTLDVANAGAGRGLLGASNAAGKLDAALLGLRTAVGSTAVIGLSAIALGAIAAGKAIRGMILATAAFEAELNTFRAVTGATADEMEAVSEAALQLGADVRLPAVTAADAAIALTELGKAGLSVQDALAGVEGVLQLATAAQITNAEAAKIAANALNSFGLAGEQATRVADLFANAANAAQGSVTDIGIAFQQASAVARQVGLSLEDTTAILSLFAKNGLQGSDAGTSLRVALIKLVAPTKEAATEIARLGLNIRDASGNVRADVFAQFGEATRNLTPAMRDASAALIFGQDAIRAVSIGAREGTDGLRLMQFELDQTGTAAEVAAARTEGFSGAIEGLNSSLTTLGITFGGPINRTLTAFARGATTATDGINKLAAALGHLFDEAATPPDEARDFFGDISEFSERAIGPITLLRERFRGTIDGISEGGLDASQKLRLMNKELQNFQTARIAAERGGQKGLADQITKEIESLRAEIKALKASGEGISTSVTAPLEEALATLQKVRAQKIVLDVDTTGIDKMIASLKEQIPITAHVEGNIQRLRDDFLDLGNAGTTSAGGVDALTKALNGLGRQASATQAELLRLQTEGGTPQQQIAALQSDNTIQRQIIEKLKSDGSQSGDASAITAARNQIKSNLSQIESLQNGLVSDQKAAATAAEKAAKDAQDARDKQFEAIAEMFGGRQENIENAIERAGIKGNVAAQIRLNKALIASFQKERAALLERLRTVKVSAAVRKQIMDAIDDAITDAKNEILRLNESQKKQLEDFSTPGADLRIRIAQARDNVAAEIAARRAKVALITKELVRLKNAGKKNTLAWLELKAQQLEEIAAIKGLGKQTEGDGKGAARFFFEQLQAQQGFAANLLGNLITGPTAGLVGVPAPNSRDTANIPDLPSRLNAESSAATGRANLGPTGGQANTEISVLGKILQELRKLNGSYDAPEAIHQKKVGAGNMDNFAM